MTRSIAALVVFTVALAISAADPPKPKFKLGKDTTFVDGPLDKDGYVDYETALNERLRGKIKPEDNAVVLLVQAIGPKPEGNELHADFYKWLGTKTPPESGDYLVRDSTFFRRSTEPTTPDRTSIWNRSCGERRGRRRITQSLPSG
jgi:hypothetical protein